VEQAPGDGIAEALVESAALDAFAHKPGQPGDAVQPIFFRGKLERHEPGAWLSSSHAVERDGGIGVQPGHDVHERPFGVVVWAQVQRQCADRGVRARLWHGWLVVFQQIERACDALTAQDSELGIERGGFEAKVPEQFLDETDVGAGLEQMRGERVP
jgi:hypothetical protein